LLANAGARTPRQARTNGSRRAPSQVSAPSHRVPRAGSFSGRSGPADTVLTTVRDSETKFGKAIARLIDDVLIDFNAYVREQEEEHGYYDYKTSFKSQRAVEALADDVHRQHQRAVLRNKDVAFHL
jgi:hypothetical protein